MAVFTYIAKDRGSLATGHSAETEYSIEIPLSKWDESNEKEESVNKSLSGTRFSVLHRIDRGASFKTVSTDDQTLIEGLTEMLDSVAAGEEFSIDPYGTIASPGTEIPVVIDGNFRKERVLETEFSFSAKVEFI